MKSIIRGFIACILPCGALDVIRIVHTNGRMEEIAGTIKASEIMKAYPKHVLKKPGYFSSYDEESSVVREPKIVIVPPDADLKRGKIYFLIPIKSPAPSKKKAAAAGDVCSKKERRTKKIAIWRPQLDSISESSSDRVTLHDY